MNDEQLIEFVRKYNVLYDLSHPKYMDSNFKLDIWGKIGREIKANGSTCRARWNNIRDNYRKSLKKAKTKSGDAAKKRKLYKYAEQLSFLKNYFDERETRGNIDSQNADEEEEKQDLEAQSGDEEENIQNDIEQSNVAEHDVSEISEEQPSTSTSSNHKDTCQVAIPSARRKAAAKRVASTKTASATLMEYPIANKNKNQNVTSPQHPVDAFLAGIAPTLKTLSAYNLHLAKSEIFATVQKFEMKTLMMEQHSHHGTSVSSVSTPLSSPAETYHELVTIQDEYQRSASAPIPTDNSLQDYYQNFQ